MFLISRTDPLKGYSGISGDGEFDLMNLDPVTRLLVNCVPDRSKVSTRDLLGLPENTPYYLPIGGNLNPNLWSLFVATCCLTIELRSSI